MSSAGLPVLPPPARPLLVLVVPVHKVFPQAVDSAVTATVGALQQQGPVAVVDLYGPFVGQDLGGGADHPGRPDDEAPVVVVRPELDVDAGLPRLLLALAVVTRTCADLRERGRAVVLVGPPAFEVEQHFWLYSGLARELADAVVLCTDAFFQEPAHGDGLLDRLLGPDCPARRRVAVVPTDGSAAGERGPSGSLRQATMVLDPVRDLTGPLGHLLGVFGLPSPSELGKAGPAQDAVRTVLDARLAPLREWDADDVRAAPDWSPDERLEEFLQLVRRAAELVRDVAPLLEVPALQPTGRREVRQLVDAVPGELHRPPAPGRVGSLPRDLLHLGRFLLGRRPTGMADELLPAGWDKDAWPVTSAFAEVFRLTWTHPTLRDELVNHAAGTGAALELAVLRALPRALQD